MKYMCKHSQLQQKKIDCVPKIKATIFLDYVYSTYLTIQFLQCVCLGHQPFLQELVMTHAFCSVEQFVKIFAGSQHAFQLFIVDYIMLDFSQGCNMPDLLFCQNVQILIKANGLKNKSVQKIPVSTASIRQQLHT